ncbi:hypothetical protein [Nocardioides bizhenqiangii]|uniref:Uncharacterized protein n=1 Tax=Nocardioides bizhenqiangii TaxID=3095076 RepID=A0ABZ0ZRG3_9ACTN|nr:hypothetical protein [Nocardioides sp. HM61]WQQ26817.1 hypothetical protein SHK19_00960 [Nocardioides sp. HM61]
MPNAPMPKPGDILHFLRSGQTYHDIRRGQFAAFVSRRGQELVVTADLIEASKDRNGLVAPWLALAHDPEAQVRRFDEQIVGTGPWPSDLVKQEPGSTEHDDARRAAVREANALPTKGERARALAEVERRYGPSQPTSRTNAVYSR